MCGEKQSLKHVFGIGSGKDCRLIVQKLSEKIMQADFMTSNLVEGILDGTVKIQEESNLKLKTEPDRKSAWIDLVQNFTESSYVSNSFYTKPVKKSYSSSDSTKSNGSSWSNLLNNFTEEIEGASTKTSSALVSSNLYTKPEKKSTPSSYSTKYNPYTKSNGNKNLPKLVGYYNKEGPKSKEIENLKKTELPETSTNNDYWSTDNLNDEELDEILKLDF